MSEIKIFTDASQHEESKMGFFAYRIEIPKYNVEIVNSGRLGIIKDSNEGEAKTILKAMKHLHDEGWPLIADQTTLITDSDFSHRLYKNTKEVSGKIKKQFEEVLSEFSMLCRVWNVFKNMSIKVVKSHTNTKSKDIQMNRWCDIECRRQRRAYTKGENELVPIPYIIENQPKLKAA